MPAVGLSTGRSLGWASVMKSFVSMLAVSMEAILRAVQQELGSAILSGSVAAPWARDGRVLSFPLRRPPVMRRLYLVLPPAATGLSERFASFAEQYAAAHFAP